MQVGCLKLRLSFAAYFVFKLHLFYGIKDHGNWKLLYHMKIFLWNYGIWSLWVHIWTTVPLGILQVIGAVGFMNQRLEIPKNVDPRWASIIESCWHRCVFSSLLNFCIPIPIPQIALNIQAWILSLKRT